MLKGDLPLIRIENLAANGFPLLKLIDNVLFPVKAIHFIVFLYISYTTQKRGMTSIIISYFLLFYT